MATGHINGVQSQGVGSSLKHFVANNQEYNRFLSDSIEDERTLRELYLASFDGTLKEKVLDNAVEECMIGVKRTELMKTLVESIMNRFSLVEGSTRAKEFFESMPIRVLVSFQVTPFTEQDLDTLLSRLNDI